MGDEATKIDLVKPIAMTLLKNEVWRLGGQKVISTVETLFDDASTRKKFEVMNKIDVMVDDSRNNDMDFWLQLDDFLKWGKKYKITIEEVE